MALLRLPLELSFNSVNVDMSAISGVGEWCGESMILKDKKVMFASGNKVCRTEFILYLIFINLTYTYIVSFLNLISSPLAHNINSYPLS